MFLNYKNTSLPVCSPLQKIFKWAKDRNCKLFLKEEEYVFHLCVSLKHTNSFFQNEYNKAEKNLNFFLLFKYENNFIIDSYISELNLILEYLNKTSVYSVGETGEPPEGSIEIEL